MSRLAGVAVIFISLLVHQIEMDEFRLLIMMPSPQVVPFNSLRVGPGALIAVDKVNADPTLLPGHTLTYDVLDTHCNAINTLGKTVDMITTANYSAFIGPLCSPVCRLTARLAVYYNIPTFSGICSSNEMLNKNEFTTLVRTFGPQFKLGAFFKSICDTFNWKRISIINDEFLIWQVPTGGIKLAAKEANFTIAYYYQGSFADKSHREILTEAASVSRIIVFGVRGEVVRQFMILANQMGLINGEYAFVCIYHYLDVIAFGDFAWDQGPDDTENNLAKEAYEALLFLAFLEPNTEEFQTFTEEVKNRSEIEYGYIYSEGEKISLLAGMVHDSVYLYAVALNETLAENGDPYDGYSIAQKMYSRKDLPGVMQMTMDNNADMDTDYMLLDMQYTDDGGFKLVTVAKYFGKRKQYEPVIGVELQWPAGSTNPPLDTPICGFEGELCIAKKPLSPVAIMAIVISVILIILLVVSAVFYRRYKLQKEIAEMLWKICPDDIIFEEKTVHSLSSKISLPSSRGDANEEQVFAKIGIYKGSRQAIKPIDSRKMNLTQQILLELKQLRDVNHANLTRFIGACVEPAKPCLVIEYCPKGSLQDILENESIKLDWMFRYSLLFDIVKGMDYIHGSFLKCHGALKSSNCLVDSRFVLKVTDFGLHEWRDRDPVQANSETHSDLYACLWRAPELLRNRQQTKGSQKADVYSFGVILQEIITRSCPYDHEMAELCIPLRDIINRVRRCEEPPFRPHVGQSDAPGDVIHLMKQCWSEEAIERPDFHKLKAIVKKMNSERGNSENILDNLLTRMEQYANNLEGIVAQRTSQLVEEQKRSEQLLHQLLPRSVAEQLKRGETVDAEAFDNVTIFFSDIVGFTELSATSTPLQVVALLNDLYTCFDAIIDHFDVYKVETIGDAYMVVSGLPIRNGNLHAREISGMALALLESVDTFQIRHRPEEKLKLRIGIHSGPVVSGVVGLKMPRYCLFGDTVNTASRMESNGQALKIHISPSTCDILRTIGGFKVEHRGLVEMKGKGKVITFWLTGVDTQNKDIHDTIDENTCEDNITLQDEGNL
ncbi:atrial natriuretic peptide receptor 1-like [Glandiceps talaboti]